MATHIVAADRPVYYALSYAGDVIAADVLPVGNNMGTPLACVSDADEAAFCGKAAGIVSEYNPLPEAGRWCEAGQIYGYDGGLIICRQSHVRTAHAPEDTPALWIVYREGADQCLEWVAGESVHAGTRRAYDGLTYECLQAHVTQADWPPDVTVTLWQLVLAAPEEPATGEWTAGVAYGVGDMVTYQGATYECLQAHTSISTWTPTAAVSLWKAI
jgi:hypothetical protein